jgi:protein disulfide-isomerase A1
VDCEAEKELCAEYRIPIYPTILVFHGEEYSIYNGKRRADAMVAFMKRHSQPVVTPLETAQRVAEFSTRDKVTIIGYLDDSDVSSNEVFTAVAGSYRDYYLFGSTANEAFGAAEKVSKPSIVIYKTFDEGKNVFQEAFKLDKVRSFVVDAATPHIREIGVDLNRASVCFHIPSLLLQADKLQSANAPMAVIFAEGQEQREHLVKALRPVAESTKEEMFWIIVDPERYPEYAPRVALLPGDWPAFGIEDQQNDFKYAFPRRGSIGDLNEAAIRQVTEDFIAKRLESSIKSEPLPEKQEGYVTTVVANNFEEEVRKSDQDVLMLFYSPTCKHCKKMAPDYEHLAELMKPFSKNLKVAQIDATGNDVWPRVSSYPTIKLFPLGNKDMPIEYEGNRSVADLFRFVRENASRQTVLVLKGLSESEKSEYWHSEL